MLQNQNIYASPRKFDRFNVNLRCRISLDHAPLSGVVENISLGGIGVSLYFPNRWMSRGETYHIEIERFGNHACELRWCTDAKFGFKFRDTLPSMKMMETLL